MICLVVGGILGGWLISRFGLKKCIWPMAIALNFPDLFYVYMAYAQPEIGLAYVLVAIEQFGYGLGFTAFMVYLMQAARGRYKTSHFAISTGIMALGMMLPGFISGYLQEAVGYRMFFVIVCVLAIPGVLTILFIPKDEKQSTSDVLPCSKTRQYPNPDNIGTSSWIFMMAQKDFFYFVEVFLARLLNRSCSFLNSGYLLTAKRIDTSSKTAAIMRVFFWLKIAGRRQKALQAQKEQMLLTGTSQAIRQAIRLPQTMQAH